MKRKIFLSFLLTFYFLNFSLLSFLTSVLANDKQSGIWVKPSGDYSLKVGHSGGKLVRSITSDPRSFNPILAKETSTTVVTSLIFDGLTRTNVVTLKVEPNLAKNWKVYEEGKRWVFNLRKDIKWSDGREFTAEDVVFTYNKLIYNPEIPSSSKDIFTIQGRKIKVNKLGKYKVEFILPVKFAPFLRSLSQEILPKHKLIDYVKKGKFNSAWGTDTKLSEIVGTGPFVLERYLPGERLILKRNPYYWKEDSEGNQLPYLNKLMFLILQDQNTALLKFLDYQLDYYNMRGQDLPILGPLRKEENFTIYNAGPAFGSNFLSFNQNPGKNPHTGESFVKGYKLRWFRNVNFRKAVAHAIDRKKIIDIVYNGLGYPQFSPLSPSAGYFYNPNVKKYPYNLEKAKSILKKEGFKDRDKDGYIEDRKGNRVEFTLFTNAGGATSTRVRIAAMIRKDLSNLGMEVNFLPLEFNNLVAKLTSTFNWEAVLIGLTGGIEPHFGKNVWHSSGHLHMWYPQQKKPHTKWEKKIDKIFNKAAQTLNREKRKKLYDRWQMIVSKKLPIIYTVLSASLYAIRDRFGNLHPTVYGGPFGKIEYVYVK